MKYRVLDELIVQKYTSNHLWRTMCTCRSTEDAQAIMHALNEHENLNTTVLSVKVDHRREMPTPPENIIRKEDGTILRAHNLKGK